MWLERCASAARACSQTESPLTERRSAHRRSRVMPATFSVLLITAAPPGHGSEAGGAFVKVDGRECLLRSTELFLNRDNVKQIQIVFMSDVMDEAKRKYGGHLSLFGVKLVAGGAKWTDQL